MTRPKGDPFGILVGLAVLGTLGVIASLIRGDRNPMSSFFGTIGAFFLATGVIVLLVGGGAAVGYFVGRRFGSAETAAGIGAVVGLAIVIVEANI